MHPAALAYMQFTGYPVQRLALTLAIAFACVATVRFRPGPRRLTLRAWRLGLVAVTLLGFLAPALMSARGGVPVPYVHDEFSYLLAADTFAHGRLTNPTPALWEHFETMHVLMRPSYQSKYPPGQGLFLALGQVLTGQRVVGAWIQGGLASLAFAWMLVPFVGRRWALMGAILVALHPQVLEWGQRYWGGTLALAGGALFLGGAIRLHRGNRSIFTGAFCGLGLIVMANSRPFEGLALSTILTAALVLSRSSRLPRLARAIKCPAAFALAGILIAGFAWMALYNYRVTGKPWRMPYAEHHSQYGVYPLFIFQKPAPRPHYSHLILDYFYDHEQHYWYARHGNPLELYREAVKNIGRLYDGSFGNVEVLAAALIVLPWFAWRNRTLRLLLIVLLLFLAAMLLETYMYPHYAAPAGAVAAALLLMCLRRLSRLGPLGRAMARSCIAVALLWSAFWWLSFSGWKQEGFGLDRQRIEHQLQSTPGTHLVFVRYGDHNVHEEWVYNAADLPGSKVIWARSMSPEQDRKLIDACPGRTPWLLEPDTRVELIPIGR